MKPRRLLLIVAMLTALVASSCTVPPAAMRATHGRRADAPAGFTMPYDAVVYLSPAGGRGAAASDFGICSGDSGWDVVFRGLPWNAIPADEVRIGRFARGRLINFCMKTVWQGNEYWAYTSGDDARSQMAFRDVDGSLGYKDRSIVERVSNDMWMLHLDDAASFLYDDNDGDVLIRIRLEKEI